MLAPAAMLVVIALDEKINLGRWEHLTADGHLRLRIW